MSLQLPSMSFFGRSVCVFVCLVFLGSINMHKYPNNCVYIRHVPGQNLFSYENPPDFPLVLQKTQVVNEFLQKIQYFQIASSQDREARVWRAVSKFWRRLQFTPPLKFGWVAKAENGRASWASGEVSWESLKGAKGAMDGTGRKHVGARSWTNLMVCEAAGRRWRRFPKPKKSEHMHRRRLDSTNDSFLGFGMLETSLIMDVYDICSSYFRGALHVRRGKHDSTGRIPILVLRRVWTTSVQSPAAACAARTGAAPEHYTKLYHTIRYWRAHSCTTVPKPSGAWAAARES